MNEDLSTEWAEIGNNWPDPIQLRHIGELKGFPYSPGYTRNLVTGKSADPDLKKHIFIVGKYPMVRRLALVKWLESRTKRAVAI